MILLLVAAGARWSVKAERRGRGLDLEPLDSPARPDELGSPAALPQTAPPLRPNVDHACAVALLTEHDGAQRVYEFPWQSEGHVRMFRAEVAARSKAKKLSHARPWVWILESSGGEAMTPSGRDTGIELRVSYYV